MRLNICLHFVPLSRSSDWLNYGSNRCPWALGHVLPTVCAATLLVFSHQVVSDSLRSHALQLARLPSPSPSPRVCPSSSPLNRWCHPTISSSVTLFSFCLQSFLASGSFTVSQLFASGGQNIGASASASVLPRSIQGWCLLRMTGLLSKGSQESSPAPQFESINSSVLCLLYCPAHTSVHVCWKDCSLDYYQ